MSFKKYDMKKRRYQEKSSDTKKKKNLQNKTSRKRKENVFQLLRFFIFLNVVSFAQTFFLPRKTKLFPDPSVDIFLIRKIFFLKICLRFFFSKPPFTNHPLFFLMKCYDFVPQHAVNLFLEP